MLGTGRLSRAAALLVSSAFVMAASAAPSERLVEGFEGRTGPIRTSNASAEIVVAAGATQGRKGLRLRFEPRDEDMVTVSLSIPAEVNAMGETNLALDVTNASGVSIHLFVTLITDDGTRQRASGVIGAGKTETLYTVLTGYEAKVETGLREIPLLGRRLTKSLSAVTAVAHSSHRKSGRSSSAPRPTRLRARSSSTTFECVPIRRPTPSSLQISSIASVKPRRNSIRSRFQAKPSFARRRNRKWRCWRPQKGLQAGPDGAGGPMGRSARARGSSERRKSTENGG